MHITVISILIHLTLSGAPGDGLDIEWENGENVIENGNFRNCHFYGNRAHGMECMDGDSIMTAM